MRYLLMICFFITRTLFAQPSTEVYLAEISTNDNQTALKNLRNVSNNEGYDNQPSFYDNASLLFAGTRNGQTDIAQYDISSGVISWVSNTVVGSEYSPLKIADSEDVSAIRLDTTGYQRLYRYNKATGKSVELLKDLKVGYHVWYTKDILVCTALVENRMDLVVANFEEGTDVVVAKNVGRSLHKIPNSDYVSYIAKDGGNWSLTSLHPVTGRIKKIMTLPKGTEDVCWLPDGHVLIPENNIIYKVNPKSEEKVAIDLSDDKRIHKISRMAVSADGKHLALVALEPPYTIVQKQVEAYNACDLEAFINCYSEDVVVSRFPNDTWYTGHERMRSNYNGLSPENKNYDVEVVKRITIGNKVIDHEKVTSTDGTIQMQVAIYEVSNGTIDSMTFIFDKDVSDPEPIVSKQLDAYNNRDIEGFLNTYIDDVRLFNYPAEETSRGIQRMREGYSGFFDSTPDLHCEIKQRIVISNVVIDEEYITANGGNFSAVAIYEVENEKITRVTFLR